MTKTTPLSNIKKTDQKQGLNRASHNPEHLNSITRIIDPSTKIFIITCGSSLSLLFLWSLFGQIPYTVKGAAVFVIPNTVSELSTTNSGNIYFESDLDKSTKSQLNKLPSLLNKATNSTSLSSELYQEQLVAYAKKYIDITIKASSDINNHTLNNKSNNQHYPNSIIGKSFNTQQPVAYLLDDGIAANFLNSLQSYQSSLTTLAKQNRSYTELTNKASILSELYSKQLSDVKYLVDKGVLPKSQILSAQQSLINSQSSQIDRESDLTQTKLKAKQKLVEFTSALIKSSRDIQILPTNDGILLRKNVQSGDYVTAGSSIAEFSQTNIFTSPSVITSLLPVASAKGIAVGMNVLVSPVNADLNKYGAIRGTVKSVDQIPISKEVASNILGSDALADSVFDSHTTMLNANLKLDYSNNISKYKWSSSDGPPYPISVGTEGVVTVILEYIRPISLVLPFLKSITGLT